MHRKPLRTWAFFALLATGLCASCQPEPSEEADDDDDSADEGAIPFDRDAYELISYELTEDGRDAPIGSLEDNPGAGENVYTAARFRLDTPMRIVAVEGFFHVREDDDKPAHLAIWPDEGHNFQDFLRESPFVEWDLDLTKDENDRQWLLLELDEPLVLSHPQLLWVGQHFRGEAGQPVLMTDSEVTPDPFLVEQASEGDVDVFRSSLSVFPDRGVGAEGFEALSFHGRPGETSAHGDLMVRLYVERTDVVEDTWFHESQGDLGSGLPGAGSVAWGDCNDDGALDVWTGALWRNNGDGSFLDWSEPSGITTAGGGVFGDYDNDGELDLFVFTGEDQLYRGLGDCRFENVTAASGINDTQPLDNGEGPVDQFAPTPAAGWLDYDNDGWLDLMQANFIDWGTGDATIDYLWKNNGDGSFSNVTEALGMNQGSGMAGRGVSPADWDNDGDTDIYISDYRLQRNYAWRNDGDELVNIADSTLLGGHQSGIFPNFTYGHNIGTVWGDVDNDGDLDAFAANLAHPRYIAFSDKSLFLRNQLSETGSVGFLDVREQAGMIYQETDSSPVFLDFDNDGLLDLFYTAVYAARPSYLYRNLGDFEFEMVSYPAGTWAWNGWGVSAADYDNDGDVDIYTNKLFRNDYPEPGGMVKVEAIGSGAGGTNVAGIGARMWLSTELDTQLREVTSSLGTGCGAPLVQYFGLGDATSATLQVVFPASGTTIDVGAVSAGQWFLVHEDGTIEQR